MIATGTVAMLWDPGENLYFLLPPKFDFFARLKTAVDLSTEIVPTANARAKIDKTSRKKAMRKQRSQSKQK